MRLVCSIRHSSESEIKIISKPVQQHLNRFDCGVYAIAYTTDIAFDRDPASLSYDRQEMRKHLLWCLQRGDSEPFPNSSIRTKGGKSITYRFQLYCHCRIPFFNSDADVDKDLFMETCAAYNTWFHKKCKRINARSLKMREKQKNWLVKRFFDDSVKNIERSKWMNAIALRELNIKNGLFSTQFNAFISFLYCYVSTQVFHVIWISRLSFEKQESLLPYICHIVTINEKRFNWVVIWFSEKFRCLGKITKICSLKKPLLYCLGFIYAGCYKIVQIFFQLFLSYFQCAKLLLLL